MSVYLDTSVVVPFFLTDLFVTRARAFLSRLPPRLYLSDFVSAEFASVLGNRIRMKTLSPDQARVALSHFDAWIARATARVETVSADVRAADAYLRRFDLTLRTPDAINIAIAQRIGAELATFDEKMADCARALRVPVTDI